jgi:hypothetical protein
MRIRISLFAKSLLMILLMEPPMVTLGTLDVDEASENPLPQIVKRCQSAQQTFFQPQKGGSKGNLSTNRGAPKGVWPITEPKLGKGN